MMNLTSLYYPPILIVIIVFTSLILVAFYVDGIRHELYNQERLEWQDLNQIELKSWINENYDARTINEAKHKLEFSIWT